MSWDATGFRVYLGSSIGDETRDLVVYADGKILSTTPQTRSVTQERAEWRGLTQAGAAAKTATASWTITARDRIDDSGQWRVEEELITFGAWTDD